LAHREAVKNSFAAVRKEIDALKQRNASMDAKLQNSFSNFKKDMDALRQSIGELKARKDAAIDLRPVNDRMSRVESSIEYLKRETDVSELRSKMGIAERLSREVDDLKGQIKQLDFSRDIAQLKKRSDNGAIDELRNELRELKKRNTGSEAIGELRNELKELQKQGSGLAEAEELREELRGLEKARVREAHRLDKVLEELRREWEASLEALREELDVSAELRKLEKRVSKPVVKEIVKEVPVEREVIREVVREKPSRKKAKKSGEKGAFSKMIDFFAEE